MSTQKDKENLEHQVNIQNDLFGQHLQNRMKKSRVLITGPYVFIFLESATFCLYVVCNGIFDISGQFSNGETVEKENMSSEDVEAFLMQVYFNENPDELPQCSSWKDQEPKNEDSGEVAGYNPAKCFSHPDQKINRATKQSEKEGWNRLAEHLQNLLPVEPGRILLEESGNIRIKSDDLNLEIIPHDGQLFTVKILIGGKTILEKRNLPYSKMLQFVFESAMAEIETRKLVAGIGQGNETDDPESCADEDEEEVTEADCFEVLKELAGEIGQPTDIIRNKSLIDLRGLVVANPSINPQPFITLREQLAEKFDQKPQGEKSALREETIPQNLRGAKTLYGAPVSLNERRDVSRPYKSTLGKNMTLAMHPQLGAVIVDKSQVDHGMKLSWDHEQGAVLVPDNEPTKRPSWRSNWQPRY